MANPTPSASATGYNSDFETGSGTDTPVQTPSSFYLGSSRNTLLRGEEQPPWIANNGLCVKKRSSHSITLVWSTDSSQNIATSGFDTSATRLDSPAYPSTLHISEQQNSSRHRGIGGPEPQESTALMSSAPITDNHANFALEPDILDEGEEAVLNDNYQWFEVQMKKSRSDEESWEIVYRGFGTRCEIKNLRPDTNMTFRMRSSENQEWGSEIVAATDIAPPSAEELQRAVDCNATSMVLRILGTSKPNYKRAIINSVDRHGHTPLMLCARNGNIEMMNIILNSGAEINYQVQNSGKTALMVSVAKGDLECVRMLTARGADSLPQDRTGATVIHYAVISGQVKILELLLRLTPGIIDIKDTNGWTPLLRAVAGGSSLSIIRTLLFRGANANAKDNLNTKSCLMVAVSHVNEETPGIVTALLEHDANPTYQNNNGTSIMDMAKASGVPAAVADMLENAIQTWSSERERSVHNMFLSPSRKPSILK